MDGFGRPERTGRRQYAMLSPLFRDLDQVLSTAIQPVARALEQYLHIHSQRLVALGPEIAFYLGGANLIQQMRAAGLPMCRPEIGAMEERVCQIKDLYNLNLALHFREEQTNLNGVVITNDVNFSPQGRIFILTGPNRGGKTTFTRAVGLAQVLFQAGLYVPGREARLSPVDGIYTHFPREEKPQVGVGRLGEEAQRLSLIFQRATRYSLVLLNESFSTTSPGESICLARDLVRALRLLGVRAMFVTHLHELAQDLDRIHANTPGDSPVVSLVAGILEDETGMTRRTFKIVPAPALDSSYAQDIARQHGISYEQLAAILTARKVIKNSGTNQVAEHTEW
jgi:DNA mismatch repair ATPase MutS